jgi:1,5-anhydro-D-fructose reductase (1,5-anhydro-D-mannitol-forming)
MALGWGIIGLGGIASRLAQTIAPVEEANLTAVCSRSREKAASFGAQYGAAKSYDSYDAMLDDPAVDVVFISSPNGLHAEQTLQALEAGKHVLVEKPVALTVADAEAMAASAKSHGLKLGCGFHLRHHPVNIEIKRLIEEGEAGDVILAQAQFCYGAFGHPTISREGWKMDPAMAGAGSIMGLGVHCIDLLCWLVGQEVVEATAFTDGPNDVYPVEFITVATFRFDGGAFAHFASSRRLPNSANGVVVYGTERRLEGERTVSTVAEGHLKITRGAETTISQIPLRDPYEAEVEAFSRAIERDETFGADGEDGVRSVEATVAVLESAATGRAVSLR